MATSMGSQPPAPVQCDICSGAFLGCHPVTLQGKVADEVGHHQQAQYACKRVGVWHPGVHLGRALCGVSISLEV